MITATYSPEDNKLRLYPEHRLSEAEYSRVKEAGFRWAPKQQLFVAPAWNPTREDLAIQLAGAIDDEDSTLVDRAEVRADRFEGYQENRAADSVRATQAVEDLTEHIPLGQPILVGHHSEKQARKHAEKIEREMAYAVKMWKTSEYWERRAAGAIRHAKYKERPDVRARRIKKIEALQRKQNKNIKQAETFLKYWQNIDNDSELKRRDGEPMTTAERALVVAGYDHTSACFTLERYPREAPAPQYEGSMSLYSALKEDVITPEQAAAIAIPKHQREVTRCSRWIEHCENRLIYEKAMLEAQGGSDLLKPKPRPKQPPLLNYKAPDGLMIENRYNRGEFNHYPQKAMTKAEYKAIYQDNKWTHNIDGHRVRGAATGGYGNRQSFAVFLTDSKEHPAPERPAPEPEGLTDEQEKALAEIDAASEKKAAAQLDLSSAVKPEPVPEPQEEPEQSPADKIKAMQETLKGGGVQTAVAHQLYPTPPDICAKMVDLAEIEPHVRVLEPSAGTGNIIKTLLGFTGFDTATTWNTELIAVERDYKLTEQLRRVFRATEIHLGDFLEMDGEKLGTFDRIIMNPPFIKGEDIKHIKHALTFLKPGGRLVALCAGGPRQTKELQPLADHWEELPEGSFKEVGTGVNVSLMVINK